MAKEQVHHRRHRLGAKTAWAIAATIDHIIPRSKGGAALGEANLAIACCACWWMLWGANSGSDNGMIVHPYQVQPLISLLQSMRDVKSDTSEAASSVGKPELFEVGEPRDN